MAAEWTPDLILDDAVLDHDHVDLFRRIARAAEALHGERAALERAVAELSDTLVHHLAREERMMDLLAYPERARHRMAHELFRADFDRMRALIAETGPEDPVVVEWLETRIPEWLRFHIRVNDVPLAHWFARKTSPTPGRGKAPPKPRRREGPPS
ncbi:MAG TPA: hemerythrin family protein [Anaeromyxobacteraceae bacterium]|nr:hemerythrin family protein [Anaeromyxobacteraceae bacterium]